MLRLLAARALQPPDRRRAHRQRRHGQDAREQHPGQAAPARPDPCRDLRLRNRARASWDQSAGAPRVTRALTAPAGAAVASRHATRHGRGPRRRRRRAVSRARARRARLRGHRLRERGALSGGKARSYGVPGSGTDGRHDLPAEHGFRFFPGFYRHLPDTMQRIPVPRAGHGVFDELVGRRPDDARARERRQRARHRRARRRPRSTTSPPSTRFMFTRLHGAGHLARGPGLLRRSAAGAADELRRAPLRAVGAAVVVGVRRRRASLAGLPQVPGRRAHAHAGRRPGAGDQRAHRRLHPAAADLRPLAAGRPRRPPARRADQRGVDRSVGRAPARRAASTCGPSSAVGRDRLRPRADRRRDASTTTATRDDGHRRALRRGDAGRAAARSSSARSWSRGRAAPGRARAGCARAG